MGKKIDPDFREEMLEINVRQKDFYESRYEATYIEKRITERAANSPTNIWSHMRLKVMNMRKAAGVDEQLTALHLDWMSDLKNAYVLDLGCFSGNPLSLWIAENCADYTGIDLSERAVALLDAQLRERQLAHAKAYAQDILNNTYPDNYFDCIYAHSVLHHFKDITVVLQELRRILKPGGLLISFDPLMTEPLNRLIRMIYRPVQSDRDWEWPFTRATLRVIEKYFEIVEMQGFTGMVKLGFPFHLIPGLSGPGGAIARWGLSFDKRHARRPGLPFYLCWQATLLLRKP